MPIKVFDIDIHQAFDLVVADQLSELEADIASDEGYLRGNSRYQDLRGITWLDVPAVVDVEANLIELFSSADDPSAAEDAFETRRFQDGEGGPTLLYNFDVGVASAVIALAAMGATPFISCNAGSFGGSHPAARPYIAFYLGAASRSVLLVLAKGAGVGLETEDGLGRLCARDIRDLVNFARLALARES